MASAAELPSYTLIHVPSDVETPNEAQLKADLEKGDTKTKIVALKKTIQMILNGEKINNLLMTIIRFVLPSQVREGVEGSSGTTGCFIFFGGGADFLFFRITRSRSSS